MLFGNRKTFAIELTPVQPSWERRSPEDQGPWAQLKLWVRAQALTLHMVPGEERLQEGLFLPLEAIARWFRRAWPAIALEEHAPGRPASVALPRALEEWGEAVAAADDLEEAELRYAWWERHFLAAADTGAWLPMVGFVRVEDQLWVSWRPAVIEGGPVFLVPPGEAFVLWEEATAVIDEFCGEVGAALAASRRLDAVLEPDLGSARALSGEELLVLVTGSSPQQAENLARRALGMQASRVGAREIEDSVAVQAARDLRLDGEMLDMLARLERSTCEVPARDGLAQARKLAQEVDRGLWPEQQGVEMARALRSALALGLDSLRDGRGFLENRFGVRVESCRARRIQELARRVRSERQPRGLAPLQPAAVVEPGDRLGPGRDLRGDGQVNSSRSGLLPSAQGFRDVEHRVVSPRSGEIAQADFHQEFGGTQAVGRLGEEGGDFV